MTDTAQKIAEIGEALEKATPRWHYNGNEIVSFDNPRVGIGGFLRDEDNYLAANAPEWLRFLIQAVEMYRELMHELDKENDHLHEKINELEKLKHERNKLIEGLRSIRNELDRRFWESDQKWEREGDMYEQGKSAAYDEADALICDILKECGVTAE